MGHLVAAARPWKQEVIEGQNIMHQGQAGLGDNGGAVDSGAEPQEIHRMVGEQLLHLQNPGRPKHGSNGVVNKKRLTTQKPRNF